jgi:hypothetical protein
MAVAPAAPPAAPAPAAPAEHFGAALSSGAAVELASILGAPDASNGKQVKVRGQVSSVCVKKGCWMTLVAAGTGAADPVRITFKDYGFFVPKTLVGKQVIAEGTFQVKVTPQAQAQHYEDDAAEAGKPAKKITGDQKELTLVASGVEVVQ